MSPAWTVYFGTHDVDSTFALALDAGANGLQAPMEVPGGHRIAVVSDPAGAIVGFMHTASEEGMVWGEYGAVAWVEPASRDVDATRSFYEVVVGWLAREGTNQYWIFGQDGGEVAGMMPSYWLPYFAVGDVDRTCERAAELGGIVIVPAMTVESMRFAVIQDPAETALGALRRLGPSIPLL